MTLKPRAPSRRARPHVRRRGPGGPQPGSGRKTRFPGKVPRTRSIWLTKKGNDLLDDAVARHGDVSQSDIIEALIREHAPALRLPALKEAS